MEDILKKYKVNRSFWDNFFSFLDINGDFFSYAMPSSEVQSMKKDFTDTGKDMKKAVETFKENAKAKK